MKYSETDPSWDQLLYSEQTSVWFPPFGTLFNVCFTLLVSVCAQWCPAHIVLVFYLGFFLLFSSCVLCMVVSNTYCVVFFFGLSSSCVLCMMLSNRYCVVFIVLFVFVLCLVYSGIQRLLWCVFCFDCVRLVSCVWWCPTHIVLCFWFVCLRLVSCVWWCPTHIVL